MALIIAKSLEEHKLEKIAEIEKLRIAKNDSYISYLDIPYNSDATARENINGKIVEIQSKISLGIPDTSLFWKDANNVIHTWNTIEEYLNWLQNLAIVIAERTTFLYTVYWTKKQEITNLANVSEVVLYNIDTGW